MKVVKILETCLDIKDINDMFCSNYNEKMMQILKSKFKNHCYKSIYILDILRIVKRSELKCKNKVLDGDVYIHISFEVSGIIYEKGDIIHGCSIVQINNNGTIHAKSKYASIYIKNIDGLTVFKEKDEIPVIVNTARYSIFETEISVSAVIFMPIVKKSIIFRILDKGESESNSASKDAIEKMVNLQLLQDLQDHVKSKKTASFLPIYKTIRETIYPFKNPKNQKTYGKTLNIDLSLIDEISDSDLVYNPTSYMDNTTISLISESDVKLIERQYPSTTIVEINRMDYVVHTLNELIKNLEQFAEFLETYNTITKFKSAQKIWAIYTLLKKD